MHGYFYFFKGTLPLLFSFNSVMSEETKITEAPFGCGSRKGQTSDASYQIEQPPREETGTGATFVPAQKHAVSSLFESQAINESTSLVPLQLSLLIDWLDCLYALQFLLSIVCCPH